MRSNVRRNIGIENLRFIAAMPARNRSLDSNESRNQGIPEARRNYISTAFFNVDTPLDQNIKIGDQ